MRATGIMPDRPGEKTIVVDGIKYSRGDEVRLILGRRRSDTTDLLFDGKTATIENIYKDYDDKVYLAVTMNDDPGQELMREFARYYYFSPNETEIIEKQG